MSIMLVLHLHGFVFNISMSISLYTQKQPCGTSIQWNTTKICKDMSLDTCTEVRGRLLESVLFFHIHL